jgi:hypothetical protein
VLYGLVKGRSDSWPPGESSSALRYGVDTRKLARRGLEVPLRVGCSGGSGAGTGHNCRVVGSAVEQDCHRGWEGRGVWEFVSVGNNHTAFPGRSAPAEYVTTQLDVKLH